MLRGVRSGDAYTQVPTRKSGATVAATANAGAGAGCHLLDVGHQQRRVTAGGNTTNLVAPRRQSGHPDQGRGPRTEKVSAREQSSSWCPFRFGRRVQPVPYPSVERAAAISTSLLEKSDQHGVVHCLRRMSETQRIRGHSRRGGGCSVRPHLGTPSRLPFRWVLPERSSSDRRRSRSAQAMATPTAAIPSGSPSARRRSAGPRPPHADDAGWLARLAHRIRRYRWLVIGVWIALTLFGGFAAGQLSSRWYQSTSVPGQPGLRDRPADPQDLRRRRAPAERRRLPLRERRRHQDPRGARCDGAGGDGESGRADEFVLLDRQPRLRLAATGTRPSRRSTCPAGTASTARAARRRCARSRRSGCRPGSPST